jgi:hypothetical protein
METLNVVPLSPSSQVSDAYNYAVPPPAPKNSVPVSGRVDIATKSRISHIVASQKFLFKNESDLVRAAVHWFLDQVITNGMDKRFQDDVKQASALIRQQQQILRANSARDFCAATRRTIESLMGEGNTEAAVQVYVDAENHAERWNEPMRTRTLEYLHGNIELAEVRRHVENWRSVQAV